MCRSWSRPKFDVEILILRASRRRKMASFIYLFSRLRRRHYAKKIFKSIKCLKVFFANDFMLEQLSRREVPRASTTYAAFVYVHQAEDKIIDEPTTLLLSPKQNIFN